MCADPFTAGQPIEVTEGKSHNYYMNEEDLKSKYKLTPDKYVAVVIDATGGKYYSHNILMRLLKVGRIK